MDKFRKAGLSLRPEGFDVMKKASKSGAALGHLRLPVSNLAAAVKFFEALGGKQDVDRIGFAVVELLDQTRIQLTQVSKKKVTNNYLQFDFKVEDIDAAWDDYKSKGLSPSKIVRNRPGHDSFVVNGPDNSEVKINSGFNRF